MRLRRSRPVLVLLALALACGPCASASAADAPLIEAARIGDVEAVRAFLDRGADIDGRAADGATALHWAAYRDDLVMARLLIDAGADATAKNRAGVTPLALAGASARAALVARLIDAGADPNERMPGGETPLMMAARTGRLDVLGVLLDRGAAVDAAEDRRGTTALMWAAANGRPEAVRFLVERGADVSARSKAVPMGRGPYLAPIARDRIDDARRGVGQAGAPARTADLSDVPPLTRRDRAGARGDGSPDAAAVDEARPGDEPRGAPTRADVPEPSSALRPPRPARPLTGGLTALVFAARQGDVESARALLDAGAAVNQTTEYGWTPLLAAVHNRHYRLAMVLLERGADPGLANQGGWTPLYLATDNRNIEAGDYPTRRPDGDHLELIAALLARGVDPNARMASSTETRTIFTHQWLYEAGATPFLRAAQSGDLALLRLLLEHGADPSIPTTNGTTPLMVASGIGWVEGVTHEWSEEDTLATVRLLLDLGAGVNAADADGRTALHGAAHKGRNDIVRLLVDHGADPGARDYGSRDSIHALAGVTWQAIDYADGLVRIGVQSSIAHPETAALLRALMTEAGLPAPPEGRTLDSICVTAACQ